MLNNSSKESRYLTDAHVVCHLKNKVKQRQKKAEKNHDMHFISNKL